MTGKKMEKSTGWRKMWKKEDPAGEETMQDAKDGSRKPAEKAEEASPDSRNGKPEETAAETVEQSPDDQGGQKDRICLDLESAVADVLQDRRLMQNRLTRMENRMQQQERETADLKKEIEQRDQQLRQKEEKIDELKELLETQAMHYDQLKEDFEAFREEKKKTEEQLKASLEKEQTKYKELRGEHDSFREEYMNQYNLIKEALREKVAENSQLVAQNKQLQQEKETLLKNIGEFTAKMTSAASTNQKTPKKAPVRPAGTAAMGNPRSTGKDDSGETQKAGSG